ncbi:MAG: hypothetical protein JW909_07310 [Planctomycetes bacterium]|nr:hypothetical protein [Planctomycetota bacterium]
MDRKTYLELIMNGTAQFMAEAGGGMPDDAGRAEELLHPYVTGVLARAEHLEDILKASGREDPDPSVWRDAVNWSEVVFRAAYLMVLEDMKEQAARMSRKEESILTIPPAE